MTLSGQGLAARACPTVPARIWQQGAPGIDSAPGTGHLPGSWNGPRPVWESGVGVAPRPGRAGPWGAGDQPSWDVTKAAAATQGSCNRTQV